MAQKYLNKLRKYNVPYLLSWEELEEKEKSLVQKQFERDVKKAEETLEHKFMVALEYCGWLPEATKEQKKIKKQVHACFPYCCFNHQVGLPAHANHLFQDELLFF